jgi:hypothetical protein
MRCSRLAVMLALGWIIWLYAQPCTASLTLNDLPKGNARNSGVFKQVFFEGRSDDTLYFQADIKSIGIVSYLKINTDSTRDVLQYRGKSFVLSRSDGTGHPIDADPNGVAIYRCSLGGSTCYTFSMQGSGIYKSGSFQNVRFYVVFSKKMAPSAMVSALEYGSSFCDLNKDKKVDFLQFQVSPDSANTLIIKSYTLENGRFVPLNGIFQDRCLKFKNQ